MARAWAAVWPTVKCCITGGLVGVTVADRYTSLTSVHGASMYPTFDPKAAELALLEKLCLDRYAFSRGDVVVFRSPRDHRDLVVKRLIALPGDWIQIPEKQEIRQIPEGHCWVEGDNASVSWDSRAYGPLQKDGYVCNVLGLHLSSKQNFYNKMLLATLIVSGVPLGLMQGRVTHILWPPNRIGRVDRKMPEGRIMPR